MQKKRKIILVSGALLLVLGAVYRFSPSMDELFTDGSERAIKIETIRKFQKKIREGSRLQQKIIDLTRSLERAERFLLEGSTTALGAVHIQNVINKIAYENELTIDSLTVKKAKVLDEVDDFVEVPVEVKVKATIRQLLNLLQKLESAPQLLAITGMQIRRITRGGEDLLYADLTVSGYMKKI